MEEVKQDQSREPVGSKREQILAAVLELSPQERRELAEMIQWIKDQS